MATHTRIHRGGRFLGRRVQFLGARRLRGGDGREPPAGPLRGWRRGLDGDTGRGEAHARVTGGAARREDRAEVTHAGGGREVAHARGEQEIARAGSGQEIAHARDGAEVALAEDG